MAIEFEDYNRPIEIFQANLRDAQASYNSAKNSLITTESLGIDQVKKYISSGKDFLHASEDLLLRGLFENPYSSVTVDHKRFHQVRQERLVWEEAEKDLSGDRMPQDFALCLVEKRAREFENTALEDKFSEMVGVVRNYLDSLQKATPQAA